MMESNLQNLSNMYLNLSDWETPLPVMNEKGITIKNTTVEDM